VSEVFRFRGMLLSAGEQATRDLNISVGCWQAMAVIRNDAMTVADISRRLGLTRQSVQQSVNRLCEQKLVRPLPNPNHRRAPLMKLAPDGIEVMKILYQRQGEIAARFTHRLGYTIDDLNALAVHLSNMREQALSAQASDFDPQDS
jgi:DNA-binding MarR family transcriptional regulator